MFAAHARDGRSIRRFTSPSLFVFVLASIFSIPGSIHAQAVYGSLVGTVTDNTGAVVPNANVTVTDISKNTSVKTATNASGEYRVDHLIPDAYRVEAEASGFKTSTVPSVQVFA